MTDRDHGRGPEHAAVILVEYGDYQCPHCRRAHPVVKALQRRFADSGAPLRFVFRNFPLTSIHPHALHPAEAAEYTAAHDGEAAFWAMHDTLFAHRQDSLTALSDRHLAEYAAAVGVDGIPAFFIDGVRFDGDWTDVDAFARALEDAAAVASGPRPRHRRPARAYGARTTLQPGDDT